MNPRQALLNKAATVRALTQNIPSPCISICKMDNQAGWCQGCFRTLDEIMRWSCASDAEKQVVWQAIENRLKPVAP
jgi:uncharacterized protein